LYLGNKKYNNENDVNIQEDDVVVICGKIVNYRGSTPETVQNKAYVVSINGKGADVPEIKTGEAKGTGTQADPYNVAGVLNYLNTLGADVTSPGEVYIKGKVKDITEQFGTQYGNATFTMIDEGFDAVFTAYRVLYLGNKKYTEGDLIKAGDEVIVCGKVVNFRGNTPETAQNTGGTLENPFTPAQANAYIATLAADTETDKDFYIKGKIIEITDKNQFNTQYGNCSFYISDDGTDKDDKFYVFRTLYLGNVKYTDESWALPKAGDEVIICGKLVNYKGNTPETSANKSYIYSLNGKTSSDNGGGGGTTADKGTTASAPFTPAEANAFIATLEADKTTDKDYYIKGKIIEITDKNQFNTQYGNCTFYLSDDGTDKDDKFYVFRTLYLGNVKYSDESWALPKAGDEVIICGKLVNYKGNTPETSANNSYIYSLNGKSSARRK
jgi:exonuclease VII large subunit